MTNPFNRPMNVMNVFVNGKKVEPELYTVKAGAVEFVKPLKEIAPPIKDFSNSADYWVVIEYLVKAE